MRSLPRTLAVAALSISLAAFAVPAGAQSAARAAGQAGASDRNLALIIAADYAVHTRSAAQAHAALVAQLKATPRFAGWVQASALREGRFTISAIGDRACVRTAGPGKVVASPGPCFPGDGTPAFTPLTDTAEVLLGYANAVSAAPGRPHADVTALEAHRDLYTLRHRRNLLPLARTYAPAGVRVTGVLDTDRDGYDDDGRVGFAKNHRQVCLTLPARPGDVGTLSYRPCADLPARALPQPMFVARDRDRVARSARVVARVLTAAAAAQGTTVTDRWAWAPAGGREAFSSLYTEVLQNRDANVWFARPRQLNVEELVSGCVVTVRFGDLVGDKPQFSEPVCAVTLLV